MSIDTVREFNNDEKLKLIREEILNPLSTFVKGTIKPDVEKAKENIKESFKEVVLTDSNKRITFTKHDGSTETLDLARVIPPEFEGIEIASSDGSSARKVKEITFEDSHVTGTEDSIHIDFNWGKIVPANQDYPLVKIGTTSATKITQLNFTGNEDKVSVTGSTLNFNIPEDPTEFTAKVDDGAGGGTEKPLKKIIIEGNTTGSEITDAGELKIKVPVPGAGGAGGNFQGFFSSLGDIESEVQNPINGKSYAFAKDAKTKDKYYTPYMYVGSTWTEAPIDPAVTFEPETSAGPQGVFSIKPDPRIKINPNGQLDLGLLGDGHFVGFFDTQDELAQACPNPLIDKTMALVKVQATGVYSVMRYTLKTDGSKSWVSVTPYGLISAVTKDTDGTVKSAKPIYAIEENNAITVDSGVISIKEPEEPTILIKAQEHEHGTEIERRVKEINFVSGIYVDLHTVKDTAIIHHPQRVINYSDTYEEQHKSAIYLGHIFYDQESHTWMGYSKPPFDSDRKWTKIIHRGMSEEVKGLTERNPDKVPSVIPGITSQDSVHWTYNSFTYVQDAVTVGFESPYYNKGLYITTIVQKVDNDDPLRPKKRIQIAYTEDENSETFVRLSDPDSSQPSSPWKGWNKISLSPNDIKVHNEDPEAHKEGNRFYKVYILNGKYKDVKTAGFIYDRTTHTLPVADNRGLDSSAAGYFKLPYPGGFKFRGRFELDNTNVGKDLWLAGVWVARVYKVKTDGQKVLIDSFTYEHTHTNVTYPGMSFKTNHHVFAKGESVLFYLDFQQKSSAGGSFVERCPYANFMAWRSYLVLEDAATDAGDKIAEAYRLTHGMFYSNEGVGVNAHPSEISNPNSWSRTYAKAVDTSTTGMVLV